jgi:hypothetical protein
MHTSSKVEVVGEVTDDEAEGPPNETKEDSNVLLLPTLSSMIEYASGVYTMYRAGKSLNSKLNIMSPLKVGKLWTNFTDSISGEDLEWVSAEDWLDDALEYAGETNNMLGFPQPLYDCMTIPLYKLGMADTILSIFESAERVHEVAAMIASGAERVVDGIHSLMRALSSAVDNARAYIDDIQAKLDSARGVATTEGVYESGSKASHQGFGGDVAWAEVLWNASVGIRNEAVDVMQSLISSGEIALDKAEEIAGGVLASIAIVAESVQSISKVAEESSEFLEGVSSATRGFKNAINVQTYGESFRNLGKEAGEAVSNPLGYAEKLVEGIDRDVKSFTKDPGKWLADLARSIVSR